MYNLNRFTSSNSFVGFNEDMKLKPEYLHHHLTFLNNFGIGQIIPGKKFLDINARVAPKTSCNSTMGFHTNRDVHMGTTKHHEGTESTFKSNSSYNRANYTHINEGVCKKTGSGASSETPDNMFRSNCSYSRNKEGNNARHSSEREVCETPSCSGGSKKSKKSKRKRRNFHKQSKKESDRCIFPHFSKKKDKRWHKSEEMEVDDEPSLEINISYSTPHVECEVSISPKIRSEISPKIQYEICLSPKFRPRMPSECESEDSFIVFEDSKTDCFSESEEEDESEDEICFDSDSESGNSSPLKKVRFASGKDLCEVHPMVQWSFAYQKARKGPWEQCALDRMRFSHRVADVGRVLDAVLQPGHRDRVYRERFED